MFFGIVFNRFRGPSRERDHTVAGVAKGRQVLTCVESLEKRELLSATITMDVANPGVTDINGIPTTLVGYSNYTFTHLPKTSEDAYSRLHKLPIPSSGPDQNIEHKFLDKLAANGVNFTRIWVGYQWTQAGYPFGVNQSGQFVLTKVDPDYLARLVDFVNYANQKNIVVQVSLSDAVQFSNRWNLSPYNSSHSGTVATDTQRLNFLTSVTNNDRVVDQVVGTLASDPDVIFEIMNEPTAHNFQNDTGAVITFHQQIATEIHDVNPRAVISADCNFSGPLYSWAMADADVSIVSYHTTESTSSSDPLPAVPTSFSKGVIFSSDGDNVDSNSKRLGSFLTNAFIGVKTGAVPVGGRGVEILDNVILGNTHITRSTDPNYTNPHYLPDLSQLNLQNLTTASGAAPRAVETPLIGAHSNILLSSAASGLVLDADTTQGLVNGNRIQLWTSVSASNQRWNLNPNADGSYTIVNVASGRVLDADASAPLKNGSRVQLWDSNGSLQQHWWINKLQNGSYVIMNVLRGVVLDANVFNVNSNGDFVQLWQFGDGTNQEWVIR